MINITLGVQALNFFKKKIELPIPGRRYSHWISTSGSRSGVTVRERLHYPWRSNRILVTIHPDRYQHCHQIWRG